MPLCLKSLELHGYKTFAAKVDFEFAEGITAIVGPNGSGKSNIADALRWVLGEQSHSLLRAKKTEDMIFAGSEQRPRSGMASATVIFDNSSGWLPIDFTEVAVARRAYRDGHNEYLLNGQQVRLRDIYELLAQSGLSERTYTILGQGLVDASLALKADERRRLFEEAAGIGLYRARREEALRRLDTTRRNLERAMDILAELEPRLKSLERQARRAQEYSQAQADLRLLLRDWYGYHWHRSQSEVGEVRERARSHEAKALESRVSYQSLREKVVSFRDHLQRLRARLNSWHRQSLQAHEQHGSISRDLAVCDERTRALLDNRQIVLTEQSRLLGELTTANERLNEAELEVTRLRSEFDEAQAEIKAAQSAFEKQQEQRLNIESELAAGRNLIEQHTSRRATVQARLDELTTRISSQQQKKETVAQAINNAQAEAHKTEEEFQHLLSARQDAEKQEQVAEKELQTNRQHLAALEDTQKAQQLKLAAKQADQARLKAQLDVLEQAEHSLAGYADGAKFLLDAARQKKLAGARGALSAALDVPAELELAITAALGEYIDAVLLKSGQSIEGALALLDKEASGRASILPLDWLSPNEPLKAPLHPDCLGIASNLIKSPAELHPALDLLLGQVLIVRDRKAAHTLLAGLPDHARAVTLRGEVFHASGQVLAGGLTHAATLSRPRQRRELHGSIVDIERQIAKMVEETKKTELQINSTREKVTSCEQSAQDRHTISETSLMEEQQAHVRAESARSQVDWHSAQQESLYKEICQTGDEKKEATSTLASLEAQLAQAEEAIRTQETALAALTLEEFQSQVTYWGTRLAVSERAVGDANTRHSERSQALERLKEQSDVYEKRLIEIEAILSKLEEEKASLRKQESELNSHLEELRVLIEPAEKELETAETQEMGLQKQETESQQVLAKVERQYTQIQLEASRKQESLDVLRQKIEDDFGLVAFEYQTDVSGPVPLPFDGMVEQLHVLTVLPPDLEENLNHQRALLRRMGPVNPEAQHEFESVRERFQFMNAQMDDLHKAEADLHHVIAELDELTKTEFFKTFSSVAEEFHDIFRRLFGGGSARLVLTDPDDLTETGIDIEARLPGRREQGLALLSGGERSLTAIALVFALLKVSPTPVCVMDEVDAMLDEANVGRFRDLLLDLSRATQFVIITHNRNTVQAADVIYGVTMGRDSTSQVISLKLDEVSEEYLK